MEGKIMISTERFLMLVGFDAINGTAINRVYEDYVVWCEANKNNYLSKAALTRAAKKLFNVNVKRRRRNGKLISFYIDSGCV